MVEQIKEFVEYITVGISFFILMIFCSTFDREIYIDESNNEQIKEY